MGPFGSDGIWMGEIVMRVIVVDDDIFVSASLKTILEADGTVEVVAVGNNGKDAIELYEQHKPDVLLIDIRMEIMDGLEAGKLILQKYKDAKILYLTTFQDDEYIVQALTIGAKGYILKQDFKGILPAIRAVEGGQSVFGGEIVTKLPNLMQNHSTVSFEAYGITEKEYELITCVAQGLSNKEIAEKMYLGEGTIRNYLSTVLEKLELRDRTQLAIFYYRHQ